MHCCSSQPQSRQSAWRVVRRLSEATVKSAYVGYRDREFFKDHRGAAFTYPCFDRSGEPLAVHFKSNARGPKGKRYQKWGLYAEDLPPRGHGKNPDAPAKIVPFGMETLAGLERGSLIVLCCGEEDALSARQAGYTSLSQPGAGLLEPAYARKFTGLEVVDFYDAGEEVEARKDALILLGAGAAAVRVVEWPADTPHGADINGQLVEDPGGFEEWLCDMLEGAKPLASISAKTIERGGDRDRYGVEDESTSGDETGDRKPTQAELLIGCAVGAELFHTPAGDAYATLPVGDHRETHPIRSKGLRRWLVRRFYEKYDRPPGAQALQDTLGLLEAQAQFEGQEMEVQLRIAKHNGVIYVDLANERWEAVEITAEGWRVISDVPVRFRRPRGMLPLPRPTRDGRDALDDLLQCLINISDEDTLRLIVAWLVNAFRPDRPFPVLILQGEQGSAKSTAERLLRALVDPSTAALRTTPRNEHDLYVAADNGYIAALDNISNLLPWLSDALCRLSTGGGFATRTLYENREQELFEGMRPIILNGITDVATRPDLLDRALIVTLPPIPESERKPEAELWVEFDKARPSILAALFDAVAGALGAVSSVKLDRVPRMADFAFWVTAAEKALGWQEGAFMDAYAGNREAATESALEADTAGGAVRAFMANRDEWAGLITELWKALSELVDEDVRRSKAWPKAPNALSGRLKRLAPALRGIGIEYGEYREAGGSRQRMKYLKKNKGENDRPDRPAGEVRSAKPEDRYATMITQTGRSWDDEG